jgi:hypothetical protein
LDELDKKDVFTTDEIKALSVRAVNQLIAESEAGSLLNSKELAEVIAGCLRHTEQGQLRNLQWFLDQKELEGMIPWDKGERAKS